MHRHTQDRLFYLDHLSTLLKRVVSAPLLRCLTLSAWAAAAAAEACSVDLMMLLYVRSDRLFGYRSARWRVCVAAS